MSIQDPNVLINEKFGIKILRQDINALESSNWLNDSIIDMYINLIVASGNFNDIYCFNSQFYLSLNLNGYERVKSWANSINIFSFRLVLMPFFENAHWSLVIDVQNKQVNFYDKV